MRGFFASSTVHKEKPVGLIPKCGSCGLYKGCQTPKMEPYGKGRRSVLFVGEAPGANEDEEGRPFVGKAGQFLRDTLDEFDVDMDKDAVTTNALICRPPDNKIADPRQIDYCRPNVLSTIRQVQPRVIVTLGRHALVSVLEPYWRKTMSTLEPWVGWAIPLEQHWVCPTYHPSYLLRMKNSVMDRQFKEHLEAAFEIDEDPPKLEEFASKVELILDDREAYKAIRQFHEAGGWVSVDYETNCIKPDWPHAKIYSCALSNGKHTISYPWHGDAIEATGKLLSSSRTRKIAANLKMEERWTLKAFGHGVANWGWDTMLATHCLDNRPDICALKFQAFVLMGVPSKIYNEHVAPLLENSAGSPYNRIDEIDIKDLLLYGGIDGLLEHRLARKQRKQMGYES